ncbi:MULTISPECIES: hypothetical protein [Paenibacillus]|uniref:Uncharacterized protein n=1 Tax=Paenibacillus alvei TaxID=44250 RepID=A0ABT4EF12_PAEAL|nr:MULTISPECIES: hypothetical protein [Paenibacillus]EPY10303.1 hypothetical protein PAAL66ix_24195 [Paenibacillus alvei A6-6i-x]MCY9530946.1 hypothetical protein [Paenibacillus alvei]SDF06926.1 hypothetical protein SAMN04488689_103521 [Paenibacillus sp. cl6col]
MSGHKARNSRRLKRHRVRSHTARNREQQQDVEFGQEAGTLSDTLRIATQHSKINHWSGIGMLAVIFSIIAFFLFPIPMGIGAAALGVLAYLQGSRSSGIFATVVGLLAVLVQFITMSS